MAQPNSDNRAWVRQDQALLSMLMSSFSDEVMPLAIGHRTSQAVWTAVVDALASSSRSRGLNLIGQLQSLHQGDSSVVDYIGKARVLVEELTLAGRPLTFEEQNLYLVTLQELVDLLGVKEFMMGGGSPAPFMAQQRGRGSQLRGGDGLGNRQDSGQTGQSRGGGRNGNWQSKCQLCSVIGHTAVTGHLWYAKDPQANIIYQDPPLDSQGSHTWFPDTGATNHATPDIAALSVSEEYNGIMVMTCYMSVMKSDLYAIFDKFRVMVEHSFNRKIKFIQSDLGTEYKKLHSTLTQLALFTDNLVHTLMNKMVVSKESIDILLKQV
ncbi:PREDICTED: uncharacterized protein LOC109158076 [Ipomoea nil]|uniref:uncharacterized protein LOC109158076 n=1 Tax=Ipomoea nil TaxID=35883 RepID=UPI0009010FA9|nr:PREDICTED: uncharacterized protein LOC109158076 [Ipomoea nil]